MKIVSIQSAVAYGHVGNSAAVFPLQRLGFDVWPVDTVQFSNHPGYGAWRGAVLDPAHVAEVVRGLDEAGVLAGCDGLLTGYLGDPGTGEAALWAVERARAGSERLVVLCDPVMGDDGAGLYVRPGIPEFLAARLVPAADIVTPNRFELEMLTGRAATSPAGCAEAAATLLARGPHTVIVTGIQDRGSVMCLAVTSEGAWGVRTPLLPFNPPVNGAGDTLSALVLAHILRGEAAPEALSLAVSSLFGILDKSLAMSRRELALVAAQAEIAAPTRLFPPLPLG